MSPHNALMTFIKSNDIQKDVLKLLNDKEADRAAVLRDNPDIAAIINSDPKLSKPTIDIIMETEVPVQRVVDDPGTRINRETEEDFEKFKDESSAAHDFLTTDKFKDTAIEHKGHTDEEIKEAFSFEKFKDTAAYIYMSRPGSAWSYWQIRDEYEKWRKGQGS